MEKDTDFKSKVSEKLALDVSQILTEITAGLMDVYLLARMFRSYEKEKLPLNYKKPADRIIVYAGYGHVRKYRDILIDIGFKLVNYTTEDISELNQCLLFHSPNNDIKKFPDGSSSDAGTTTTSSNIG